MEDIRMAKELGMSPQSLQKNQPSQVTVETAVKDWIGELYAKRFAGKHPCPARTINRRTERNESRSRKMTEGPRRFDCPAFCGHSKPDRQSAASNRTYPAAHSRAFVKPRSTSPSSIHATPTGSVPLWFKNARSVRRVTKP